jgi:ABC-type antimicrobial peptide transport system permease subunit
MRRQEFAILRAIGAKPIIIVNISAIQSGFLLFFSFGVGITLGTTITMMILMANPVITVATVLVICTWLIAALIAMLR